MIREQFSIPIVFLIFNRPDKTQEVFSEISKVRPKKMLVVADGPRENRPGELENCMATRSIINQVDWDCEILTNYSEKNLGCKKRISSGLDWVFENVPEAIILEDDCLPDITFFRFCEEMLNYYRDDEQVAMISGNNFQFGLKRGNGSYYFSRYSHIWGWATWRRAWLDYDVELSDLPRVLKEKKLNKILKSKREVNHWKEVFQATYDGKIDTWDYQWFFTNLIRERYCVMPNCNLISNIGFGEEATHTTSSESKFSDMTRDAIEFPLVHPKIKAFDEDADNYTYQNSFKTPVSNKIKQRLIKVKTKFLNF